MLACGPPWCADVTSCDSVTDSPMQGLSFNPTLMVVGIPRCPRVKTVDRPITDILKEETLFILILCDS